MDQDFHYYGTYYAAKKSGFNKDEATLIAKAANFIDFLNEDYPSSWSLVGGTKPYVVNARYTFQGGMFQQLLSPQDSVWCAYHFTPGNYNDPSNTPSRETVHGRDVANYLPGFQIRDTNGGRSILGNTKYYPTTASQYLADLKFGQTLNRPQSALSRQLIMDTIRCATDDVRLKSILAYATGGQDILQNADNLRRFKLILLGVRAHVIADTWAHQDFCGLNNVLNTYWDVNYDPNSWDPAKWGYGRESIDYNDGATSAWKNTVLSGVSLNGNFQAAPNSTTYLGHGWMGHFPDYSFVKFRYKPCWADPSKGAIERNNPQQYQPAWMELVSLFSQAAGRGQLTLAQFQNDPDFNKAAQSIQYACNLEGNVNARKSSANAWKNVFGDLPSTDIDVNSEPDVQNAVLDGMNKGTNQVRIDSDLYLFQIAADYHFHFVKDYLERNNIYRFTGSWSQQTSALSPDVSSLFVEHSNVMYASYEGSQQGVTVRDLKLNQLSYFNTGINAKAITTGSNNDVYLASGNCLYNYSARGALLRVMTFPIPTINYTSVAVHGDKVYASYTGSQQGVTIRDLKLNQILYFNTGVNASGIAAGSNNDLYLAAGNHLLHYTTNGTLIADMTFPDTSLSYTDIAVKGNHVLACYAGSQKGVTVRDLQLVQLSWFNTGINARGITAGINNDVYLAAGNHLYNYNINGTLITDMTFPIGSISYTDISC